ncbi:MAG: 50S ribosomal protein L25/general stress protein Ctc [Cytophagaceae bacterium]|nr:50S ribosomal protein L25/general stress protein Ctc [Cytophagaceae bacterium]
MKTLEIIGFKRANLGKQENKKLREEANVPCVLYGGKEQVHFYAPMFLFRDLVYTPNVHKVNLSVEGKNYDCILQDIQFHSVNEMILHADFLELAKGKPVKMEIPISFVGQAPGVLKGGKLIQKLKKITVRATPENLPDHIEIDVNGLELNKSIKVGDLKTDKYEILNSKNIPVVSVQVPRALKLGDEEAAGAAAATAEATPAAGAEAKKEEKAPAKKEEKK